MHRAPLWFAVVILLAQLYLAIVAGEFVDKAIWWTIALNAIFIVVGITRKY